MTSLAAIVALAALAAAPVHMGAVGDAKAIALVSLAAARGRLRERVVRLSALGERRRAPRRRRRRTSR